MSVKWRHWYVCLIWIKTCVNVKDFFKFSDGKTGEDYFEWLSLFPYRSVMVGSWHCWRDHICRLESPCLNVCIVFAQIGILIKLVRVVYYLTVCVSKPPCETHTKSNWKWIPKYAECDIQKRMRNCYLSVKHTESSNYLLMSRKLIVSIIIHVFEPPLQEDMFYQCCMHCIVVTEKVWCICVCGTLAQWQPARTAAKFVISLFIEIRNIFTLWALCSEIPFLMLEDEWNWILIFHVLRQTNFEFEVCWLCQGSLLLKWGHSYP
jgi:hypothetical protein